MRSTAFAVAAALVATASPAAGQGAERATARALAAGLDRTAAWQRLQHPRDDTPPRDALAATLDSFFAPQDPAAPDAHARCRFPARYAFLAGALDLDAELPARACPALDAFLERMQAEAVGLVYVGASLRHPASAMGHLFVVIGPRAGFGGAIAGKHAVDFTPIITTHDPLSYVVAGMSGGFEGVYRIVPFADKLDAYNDGEDRDIWQYELRLTPAEARRVALHLWEREQTSRTFYYLSDNCAHHALSLIEASVPRLDFSARVKRVVMPLDAIGAIHEAEIHSITTFPARTRQALENTAPGSDAGDDHPAAGHAALRVRFGPGITSRSASPFAAFGFRFALHDLVDPPRGHAELVQVQLFDSVLRLDWAARQVAFDEITFMELMTLRPMSAHDLAPSWRIRFAGMRIHDAGCPRGDCFVHGIHGGIGAAVATAGRTVTLFGMAEGWTLFGADLDGIEGAGVRLGLGPAAGIRLRVADVVAMLSARSTVLPGQDPLHVYDANAELRVGVDRDAAIGVEGTLAPGDARAMLWSYFYF